MCTHRLSVTGRNHNLSRWRQVITHLKQTECDMSLRDCWHSLQLQHLKVLSNEMYCFLLRFNSPFLSYLRLQKPSLTQLSLSVSLYPTPAPKVWKRSHADGSVKLLKLWIWHPYWMLISISVYVPTSKRCSTLRRLAPAGLCKKCTALNLPNCCCFNCEEETKAGNYTCRMENNREGWQWRRREQRDRREDRQERVTRGKQDNDLFRLSPPVKRETVKGWLWSATYFSMRSNVTPGTNLALFCIQNLGGKHRERLVIRAVMKTRGAHRRDNAIKAFGLYSTNFMTNEGNNQRINTQMKNEPFKDYNHWALISVFWLSYSQRGGGKAARYTSYFWNACQGGGGCLLCAVSSERSSQL